MQIIVGELKVLLGEAKSLNEETQAEYEEWRSSKEHILPGDVYNLVRYNQRLALRARREIRDAVHELVTGRNV